MLKIGEGTPNEKTAEQFGKKPTIRNYYTNNNCPYDGAIDDIVPGKRSKHFGSGFVPLKCYKAWLSGIVANVAQDVADSLD